MRIEEENRKKLYKIMEEIVEKYKDRPLLYKKLKKALDTFQDCRSVNPEIYKEIANLTKLINFRCNFVNGRCKKDYRGKMCCCTNCENWFGHLTIIFFSHWDDKNYIEEEMLYYAKKYSINTGFWREGIGCILPRHKRSPTCLIYNCNDKITPEETLVFDILRWNKPFPPYINKIIKMLKNHFLYEAK